MPNSRGEERRRRSDMPGSQAVRVVFRSRPWSGTARAATPRAESGSRVGPEPDRAEGCVWPAVAFPRPGLAVCVCTLRSDPEPASRAGLEAVGVVHEHNFGN